MNKNNNHTKGKILFSTFLIAFLLISTNRLNVAVASPETNFYVDPSEVRDVQPGDTFLISVNVTDAPPSYAWEVHISWDPNILQAFFKLEGDFLERDGAYTTTFTTFPLTPPWDAANLDGEMTVGCSLLEPELPMNEWASGDGWLFNLGFNVTGQGSSVISLSETLLIDHFVAGAAQGTTYYPDEDGFFYNTAFHDVAVSSVTRNPTEVEAGEAVTVNVTVTNEGNFTETSDTFNVTVYADAEPYEYTYDAIDKLIKNTTVVGDEIIVGTKTLGVDLVMGATTTLTFTWDTTGVEKALYTISAEAMGDNDTRDNLLIDHTVAVGTHDIAITNVVPSPTEVTVGDNVTINVTVENQGSFNETFDVTVYYDGTVIETKTDISLENDTSTTLTFTWNTTDVAKETYTIKANASVVPDETDTDDNTLTSDVTVKVRGAPGPDILLYVAVAVVIIIVAAIALYFLKFRKPT